MYIFRSIFTSALFYRPIFIPPNCLFDMDVDVANITAPPNCDGISPLSVLEIFIVTPEPATVDQIIIGGPPSFIEQPIVAATVIVMPSTLLPTAAPAPVPAPVPIPIPDPVTVKSDPHLKGIKYEAIFFFHHSLPTQAKMRFFKIKHTYIHMHAQLAWQRIAAQTQVYIVTFCT